MFRQLDKDGDGLITAEELRLGMMESIERKIKQMIEEADKDGDGHINFLEFSKVSSAMDPQKGNSSAFIRHIIIHNHSSLEKTLKQKNFLGI